MYVEIAGPNYPIYRIEPLNIGSQFWIRGPN
jgi:hypothetical protein